MKNKKIKPSKNKWKSKLEKILKQRMKNKIFKPIKKVKL